MSTVIGLDAFKMLLEQRPSQRAVFKTDGNIEGLTTFHSQGHFENSGGKKLISHRVILTDDDIKRVLPHSQWSIKTLMRLTHSNNLNIVGSGGGEFISLGSHSRPIGRLHY